MNGHPPIKLLFLFILVYSIVFYMYMALHDLNQVLPEVWLTASSWIDAGVVPFFNDSLSVYPSYMIQGEELKETAAYRIGAANRLRWSFPQSMEIITGMFWQKKPVLWILSLARIWWVYTQTSVARNLGNHYQSYAHKCHKVSRVVYPTTRPHGKLDSKQTPKTGKWWLNSNGSNSPKMSLPMTGEVIRKRKQGQIVHKTSYSLYIPLFVDPPLYS